MTKKDLRQEYKKQTGYLERIKYKIEDYIPAYTDWEIVSYTDEYVNWL